MTGPVTGATSGDSRAGSVEWIVHLYGWMDTVVDEHKCPSWQSKLGGLAMEFHFFKTCWGARWCKCHQTSLHHFLKMLCCSKCEKRSHPARPAADWQNRAPNSSIPYFVKKIVDSSLGTPRASLLSATRSPASQWITLRNLLWGLVSPLPPNRWKKHTPGVKKGWFFVPK